MPIYTLKCIRCDHVQERGFTVSGFLAQTQQGFRFISCSRCSRKGVLEHDFMADVRTQVIHNDEYTFGENAPEEGLVNKTVSKSEAKAILKKHGLVEAGKSAKRKSTAHVRSYTQKDIEARWAEKAKAADNSTENDKVAVDTKAGARDTIVADTWLGLKSQAKSLGIKYPPTTKRPELERLVREQLNP